MLQLTQARSCVLARAVPAAHALVPCSARSPVWPLCRPQRRRPVPLQPSLGDVLLCLLSALGAAQQMMRTSASLAARQLSLGPWRGNEDAAAGESAGNSLGVGTATLYKRSRCLPAAAAAACRGAGSGREAHTCAAHAVGAPERHALCGSDGPMCAHPGPTAALQVRTVRRRWTPRPWRWQTASPWCCTASPPPLGTA